jgi:hypothetical protein
MSDHLHTMRCQYILECLKDGGRVERLHLYSHMNDVVGWTSCSDFDRALASLPVECIRINGRVVYAVVNPQGGYSNTR